MDRRSWDAVVIFAVLIILLTMDVGGTEKMRYVDILLRIWGAFAVSLGTLVGYRIIREVWAELKAEFRYKKEEDKRNV